MQRSDFDPLEKIRLIWDAYNITTSLQLIKTIRKKMKPNLLIAILLLLPEIKAGLRTVHFECWNTSDSIQLPTDGFGTEYYSTEEVPIMDFKFK